jgi:hypothetical protein
MFKTLTRALNMFSIRNMYYNISDKQLVRRYISNYSTNRIELLCCNAANNKCDCVRTCKRFEPLQIESNEKKFKCVITNLPPRTGYVDCKCESMCMTKKSETMTIMDPTSFIYTYR